MNITLSLRTGTGKLFVDLDSAVPPMTPNPLHGFIVFGSVGKLGCMSVQLDGTAHPDTIDGAPAYRLTFGDYEGVMRPNGQNIDGQRQYAGHLGSNNELHVTGTLEGADDMLPAHIHLTITSNSQTPERAEPTIEI
ncbi:hypothetical protein ACG02S_25440 [Roseateles sp. DC23W]|uniref:Uncharacterized protein n=1 Tax=Pelomonas dachongensis TaxID=3299029 RepID=A0ABW7EVU6_9BURK